MYRKECVSYMKGKPLHYERPLIELSGKNNLSNTRLESDEAFIGATDHTTSEANPTQQRKCLEACKGRRRFG
jgi:hypothetical protein